MKIPKRFKLGGIPISVSVVNNLNYNEGCWGLADYRSNTIQVQGFCDAAPRPKESIEQTFCHELVHWILYPMSETELRQNEKFVDILASHLHQFIKTSEYKK